MAKNTKEVILSAGVDMWLDDPMSVNAHAIANKIGMTHGAVMYHFPKGVRNAVAEYAVETKNANIIIQLIASGHKAVDRLTSMERAFYLSKL